MNQNQVKELERQYDIEIDLEAKTWKNLHTGSRPNFNPVAQGLMNELTEAEITKKDCIKIESYTGYVCDYCAFHKNGVRVPAEYKTIRLYDKFASEYLQARKLYYCEKCYNKLTE